MTDDNATSPTANDGKDPLAVLEGILQDAKNKSAGAGAPVDEAAAQAAAEQAEQAKQAELAAQQAQEKARQAALEAERQQQIAEQQATIQQELPKTPQFQARQQQVAAESEEKQAASSAGEGYEIRQLSHTAVPASSVSAQVETNQPEASQPAEQTVPATPKTEEVKQ